MKHLLANRRIRIAAALLVLAAVFVAIKAAYDTMRDPVVERLVIESDALPRDAAPVTIAFITDLHVAGPDMSPQRLQIAEHSDERGQTT